MPVHPVLEAFGGNLKIVGTGTSTANQHAPHFADDVRPSSTVPEGSKKNFIGQIHGCLSVATFPWPLGQGTIQHAHRGPNSNFLPS